MTAKTFFNKVANGKRDILTEFVELLKKENISYCLIGGLAVNVYAETLISLDVDIVVAVDNIDRLLSVLPKEWKVKYERFSINISSPDSELRIQILLDTRYQDFIGRAVKGSALGHEFSVALLEDVLQEKLWALSDPERRESKRLKDRLDVSRLVEAHPEIFSMAIGKQVKEILSKH